MRSASLLKLGQHGCDSFGHKLNNFDRNMAQQKFRESCAARKDVLMRSDWRGRAHWRKPHHNVSSEHHCCCHTELKSWVVL